MNIKKAVAVMAVSLMAMLPVQMISTNAVVVEKYVPIIDTLHVTPSEEPTTEKTYENMTDPEGPFIGAGDVPAELKNKLNTELHNDPVPEDTEYDGYYIIKNGEKTYIAGDN